MVRAADRGVSPGGDGSGPKQRGPSFPPSAHHIFSCIHIMSVIMAICLLQFIFFFSPFDERYIWSLLHIKNQKYIEMGRQKRNSCPLDSVGPIVPLPRSLSMHVLLYLLSLFLFRPPVTLLWCKWEALRVYLIHTPTYICTVPTCRTRVT